MSAGSGWAALAVVDTEEFRRRLEALEAWIWSDGFRRLGLGGEPPQPPVIADRVLELSDLYTLDREDLASRAAGTRHLVAKALYFLCSDAPKVHAIASELRDRYGGIPLPPGAARGQRIRIDDLGCGTGATIAGLLLSLSSPPPLTLTGIDADPRSLDLWTAVAFESAAIAGIDAWAEAQVMDLATESANAAHRERAALVIAQGFLNECAGGDVAKIAAHLGRWSTAATTIAIEPALRVATRPLHAARDLVLADGRTEVLAPCPHQRACPMLEIERDWCHEVRHWKPTPRVAAIQEVTIRRDERMKYSFVVLAPAGTAAVLRRPDPAVDASTETIGRIVSDALESKGKTERFLCTTAGALVRLRLLDRERTEHNALLAEAQRGTLVRVEGDVAAGRVGPAVRVRSLESRVSSLET